MIRKLRLKFVAICMTLVTAILVVVFLSMYVSMQRNVQTLSQEFLHQVAQDSGRMNLLTRPGLDSQLNGDRTLLPYFTVEIWGNQAFVTGGTYDDLENTEELEAILNACVKQNEAEGVLEDYRLRYLRQDGVLYQKIAFVDMSMEVTILRAMMGPYLAIALVAILLLLVVSILLSWWATRPVARAWEQQRQFISDASHELKTPLTVILSNAELLEASPLEERPARWADNIHSESLRMKSLVEEMLTLARADNAPQTTVFSEVSLSDIAGSCVLAFDPVAFEAGKGLEEMITPDITVSGDGEKLRQLISVLLDNAIKYGSADSPICLTLERNDRVARLTVSNSGEPIPPAQLEHLFERFYRADESRGQQSGFGLGLSIAASIAREHKATLKAESDSISTRFILTIPLKK